MSTNQQDTSQLPQAEDHPGLNVAFDEAKRQIDFQFSQIDGLDTKASICIGFAGVLLTLTITVLPTLIRHFDYVTIGLVLADILYTLLSFFAAIIAMVPRVFENAPSIQSLTEYYLFTEEKAAKLDLLQEFKGVILRNYPKMKLKMHFVPISVVLLIASVILFIGILVDQLRFLI